MTSLDSETQLDRAMEVEGYKVLPPCVLYGKIGQGGMGAVYRGRHLNLDIDVAVKCLKPGLVDSDEQFVVRFRREARSAAQINHQNVVRVFDVAEDKGLHYIVMELVQGETARERVLRKKQLAVGEALEIVHGAALGLAEAHRKGFIHRDIKPDNIMIASNGQVKVADLGLAKPAMREDQASLLSGTNVVMGTPQYMPPEQWENTSNVTPAADVWALGATLYYLLVGDEAIAKDSLPRIMQRIVLQPFPDVRTARPDVPADVAELIAVATQQLPGARYQDAQQMADAMDKLATRRQSLRDRDAAPTTKQNTLLSPPPAKTLARIKFWLDEHQRGGASTSTTATATPPGPSGTQVMAPPGVKPSRTIPWLLLLGAAALAVVFYFWQPHFWQSHFWQSWLGQPQQQKQVDPFAAAITFENSKQYDRAIAEVERIHAEDPGLPGKAERLARLHGGAARQFAEQDRLREAMAALDRSLAASVTTEVQEQKRALLARIVKLIEQAFERQNPGARPVPRGTKLTFRGRLAQELVVGLTIAETPVTRGADGSFACEIDPKDALELAVRVDLWNGQAVTLQPWSIAYELPVVVPITVPNAKLPLEAMPKVLELDDDREAVLTIRLPRAAELTIDGVRVERSGTEETYLKRVRSDLEEPVAIELLARQEGYAEARLTVPVKRLVRPWSFVKDPQFLGVKKTAAKTLVTPEAKLQVQGTLNDRADRVLVNGVDLGALQWRDNTFTGSVELQPGLNLLRIEAQKRFRPATVKELSITRLGPPSLSLLAPAKDGDTTDQASYALGVNADEGTVRVIARCGSSSLVLTRDGDRPVYRGQVPLAPGQNVIVVEALNVVDLPAKLELRVTRSGAAAPPVITAVEWAVGERWVVANNGEVFLKTAGVLRIQSTDPAAAVTINGKPIERSGETQQVDLQSMFGEGTDTPVELRLVNALGRSEAYRCRLVVDRTTPEVEVVAPTKPVGKGRVFELRGRWVDTSGLQSVLVGDIAGDITPGRGKAKRGEWLVRMEPIDAATDVQVVVTDRAGNATSVQVRIEVQ